MARQAIYFYQRTNGVEKEYIIPDNCSSPKPNNSADNNQSDVKLLIDSFQIWATPKK